MHAPARLADLGRRQKQHVGPRPSGDRHLLVPPAQQRLAPRRPASCRALAEQLHPQQQPQQQTQQQQSPEQQQPQLPQSPQSPQQTPPQQHPQWSFGRRAALHDAAGRLMLKNLTLPELEEWCASVGERRPAARARQVWRWLYSDGAWAASLEETLGRQNGLSAAFCAAAGAVASVDGGLLLDSVARAADGTRKLVFKLTEGPGAGASIEAVLIPMAHRRGERNHVTLCVSSQVGCAMACQFCFTGRMGLLADLSTAQIVEQVRRRRRRRGGPLARRPAGGAARARARPAADPARPPRQMVVACRVLAAEPGGASIANVVFMVRRPAASAARPTARLPGAAAGPAPPPRRAAPRRAQGMGEPLANFDAVMAAVAIMTHPLGLHVSHNKLTVSTVGLVAPLERFATSGSNVQLALSLHATTDEVRDWIVPTNKAAGGLSALMGALRRHYAHGNAAGRRVLVEFTMLAGVNDTPDDARRLVALLEGIEAKVNLIMFNPFAGTRFRPSPMEAVLAFRSVLVGAGRICTIRDSRGDDSMAACGQLGNLIDSARSPPLLPVPPAFEAVLAPPA
ncbi:rlmN [Scenedesmus sp. PABB004]|nr:rlmN [Scenedesmus sp. PABB004]